MAADGDPPKKSAEVSTKSDCDQFLGSSPERAVSCRPNGGQLMAADGDPPKKRFIEDNSTENSILFFVFLFFF